MAPRRRSNLSMETVGGTAFDIVLPQPVQRGSDALNRISEWKYKPKSSERDWQESAYAFAREIPEIGQAIEHTANTVKNCDLVVLVRGDEGEAPAEPESQGDIALRALVSEMSDSYDEILYSMARALQIAGECYLVGEGVDGNEAENGLTWEVYSIREMVPKGQTWEIMGIDGFRPLPDEAVVDRLHRPDAEYRFRASSPMRRVLSLCGQLLLLEQNVKAIAESRLSAQVWYMPEDITLHTVDETQASASGPNAKMNPVVRKFLEHASAPINNPDSAARLVPLVMTGPEDGKDRMGIIDVTRAPDAVQSVLREEVITRIARGLDIPIEVIFGIGDTNHWTSYGISAQFLGDHIEPLGNRIAAFLTRKYLRPMLMAGYDMDADEASKYRVVFDTSPVTSRVDDGPATRAAFDRGVASEERYRSSIGLTSADAPEIDEKILKDLRAVIMGAKATYGGFGLKWLYMAEAGDISAQEALMGFNEEWEENRASAAPAMQDNEDDSEEDPEEDPNADPEDSDDEAEEGGTPEDQQDEPERNEGAEAAILLARIEATADRDLRSAINRAASRTISKARAPRFSDILGRLNLSTNKLHQVANLSDNDLRQLSLNRAGLIDPFADLEADVEQWVFDFLDEQETNVLNEGKAARIAYEFSSAIHELAIGALSSPIPSNRKGSLIPAELVEKLGSELA